MLLRGLCVWRVSLPVCWMEVSLLSVSSPLRAGVLFYHGVLPLMSCLCWASAQARAPLLCILTSGVARGGTEAYRPLRVCVCVYQFLSS